MRKKGIVFLLTVVLILGSITGCGQNENQTQTDSTGTEPSGTEQAAVDGSEQADPAAQEGDDLASHRTITAWLYPDDYSYYSTYDENPVVQYLNEKFNCELTFQQPAMGSEQDQFNLMLGTGEYTDVFEITYAQDNVSSLYADGVIQDLAPYLETYMPNFYNYLHAPENEEVNKSFYDGEGHLFTIPTNIKDAESIMWGGLVYRRDILETMTGGNIAFPSGNEHPSTIEDWDYMFELMSNYFQSAGMTDYACLILPWMGYFQSSHIVNGFGASGDFMVKDGTVAYGPTTPEFYNYLVKMKEWYDKGYIYQDFASRTNDLFYLPNTALTYGAAAGVWFGLSSQVDGQMSMPEYDLYMDVKAIPSPLDTANGQDGSQSGFNSLMDSLDPNSNGWVVSTNCSEENLIRFLTVADYLFTEEGAMIKTHGFSIDQGTAEIPLYEEQGVAAEGAWYMNPEGTFTRNALFTGEEGREPLVWDSFRGIRLPGLDLQSYTNLSEPEYSVYSSDQWLSYGGAGDYPRAALGQATADESSVLADRLAVYTDYLNTAVPKFIIGSEELNEDTFAAFVEQMNQLGVAECIEIRQDILDRFNG